MELWINVTDAAAITVAICNNHVVSETLKTLML